MVSRLVVFVLTLGVLLAHADIVAQSASTETDPRADWIPVGSVPEPVVRSALEAKARFQSGSLPLQRGAIDLIRGDIERYGTGALRIAAVPVLVDLLGIEYRILEVPTDYHVDPRLRVDALQLLSTLGGEEAITQLRESVLTDDDAAVRTSAAILLASGPSDDPDRDLDTISRALSSAVRRGAESEVSRLLAAADAARRRAWSPEHPLLIESCIGIVQGPYSASLRRRATDLLEELAER